MQCTVSELEVRVRTASHKQKEEERRSLDHMMHFPAEAACSYKHQHIHIQQAALTAKFYSGFSSMCRGQKTAAVPLVLFPQLVQWFSFSLATH